MQQDKKKAVPDPQTALNYGRLDDGFVDPHSLTAHLKTMDSKSIEDLSNELREAFMQLKDLSSRCLIDMEHISKNDNRVFYFKPQTVFLEDPEKQRQYFQRFFKDITQVNDNQEKFGLAEQLDKEVRQIMVDDGLSDPSQMRPFLSDFFQRRLYGLQHRKQKMLTRWAHFALTASSLDKIGQQGAYSYGRLEYETENCMRRYERLCQKDGFEEARDGITKRPETAEINDLADADKPYAELMQEREDKLEDRSKEPISCIRIDDFEIYLRIQTYQNKLYRPILKFIARGKWIPIRKGIDIYKQIHLEYVKMHQQNIDRQSKLVQRLRQRFQNSKLKKTVTLEDEHEEILLEDYEAHRSSLVNKMRSSVQQGKNSGPPEPQIIHEKAPQRLTNLMELYCRIEQLTGDFNIQGDVEIDNGFSIAYHVQVSFMTYYQRQIIESTFSRYNQLCRDPQESTHSQSKVLASSGARKLQQINDKILEMNSALRDILNPSRSDVDKLYEKFDGDFAHDFSEVQKRALKQLLLIDFMLLDLQNTNQDGTTQPLLKKGKKINEQIPDLRKMFEDIKVYRLKYATWVYEQPILAPIISEEQRKQDIILSDNFYPDQTLKALLDFVDICDPSMVNVLYKELAKMYQLISQETYGVTYLKEHVKEQCASFQDETAKKFFDTFSQCLKDNIEENEHKKRVSREEIAQMRSKRFINQDRKVIDTANSELRNLPSHIVQSYMQLKHMRMRDSKNRLLKVLNFYRSVQKRMVLEGKDFARREAVNNHTKVKLPQEAFYVGRKAHNLEEKFQEMGPSRDGHYKPKSQKDKNHDYQIEDEENIATLIDIKRWKFKGQFHYEFLATCPQPMTIEGSRDLPMEERKYMSGDGQMRSTPQHISEQSKDYLNRMDQYEIDEEIKEIHVLDDYGVHIMYDASLQDMVNYERHLLQVGTYFIRKTEHDFDFDKFEFCLVDRIEVLDDLLCYELDYQFHKAQIVLAYLDAFEHCCDPLIQQRLMQIIIDVMAWKPKLDYQRSWYFKQSYEVEIRYLSTYINLLREINTFQMSHEFKENQNIKRYLDLSYKAADAYANMEWTDVNPEKIKDEIGERRYVQNGMRLTPEDQAEDIIPDDDDQQQNTSQNEENQTIESKNRKTNNKDKKKTSGDSAKDGAGKKDGQVNNQDGKQSNFVEQLDYKAPDMKDMMKNQSAVDSSVEEMLDKDANFMKTQEGFPNFFRHMNDQLSKAQFSNGTSMYNSRPFGVLDFYESLSVLPNVHSMILQGQSELKKDLNPAGPIQHTIMNTLFLEHALVEFVKSREQSEGSMLQDYQIQQLIENDLVMGNPDKLLFLLKDMIAQLNRQYKKNMNPLLVAKLDLHTINHFPFANLPFSYFKDSSKGDQYDVTFSRKYIETQIRPKQGQAHFFPKLRDEEKNITIPPTVLLFCNLADMLRMRETLILQLQDTKIMEEIFDVQKKLAGRSELGIIHSSHLNIGCNQILDEDQMNFIESGNLLAKYPDLNSGLAIDEICPTLRANLNFMNPESIQTLILDSGLNNLKVTLHYQVIQKQLIQTSVLANYIILQPYQKLLVEIDLLLQNGIRMPNGLLDYSKFTTGRKKIEIDKLSKLKSHYKNNEIRTHCTNIIMPVNVFKQDIRLQIKQRFEEQRIKLEALGRERKTDPRYGSSLAQPINQFALIRLLNDFKHSLVHVSCRKLAEQVTENATRVELMYLTHKELKQRLNYFSGFGPESHIFRVEANHPDGIDHPSLQLDQLKVASLNFDKLYTVGEAALEPGTMAVIPSLQSISLLKNYPQSKERQDTQDPFEFFKTNYDYDENHLDLLVYKNISGPFDLCNKYPRLIKALFCINQKDRENVYPLDIYRNQSLPGRILKVYQNTLELFEYLYFQVRGNIKPVDAIEMQNASDQGRKYWKVDEANNNAQKGLNLPNVDNDQLKQDAALSLEDEALSQKIIDKIMNNKRGQNQVFDDFQAIINSFETIKLNIDAQLRGGNFKLDSMLQSLRDHTKIQRLRNFKYALTGFDKVVQSSQSSNMLQAHLDFLKLFTSIDLQAPYYLNGLILNTNLLAPRSLRIQQAPQTDFQNFRKTVSGLEFQEDVVPSNCSLVLQLVETFLGQRNISETRSYMAENKLNYFGQLHFMNGNILSDLRNAFLNLDEKNYAQTKLMQNTMDSTYRNLLLSEEFGSYESVDDVSAHVKVQVLENQINSLMLKVFYMILLAGQPFPKSITIPEFERNFVQPYTSRAVWRINAYVDAENKRIEDRKKQKEKWRKEAQNLIPERMALDVNNTLTEAIQNHFKAATEKQPKQKAVSSINQEEAAKVYMVQRCQQKVLTDEITKIFMIASKQAMDVQVAAISRSLEMASNRIDKYIPPKQGFCATLFDDVNRHQHLEVVSKLSAIQVFLTKLRNRALPIKTLTSGPGIVSTFRDLNECIHDFCADMIQFSERQLKLRTEAYQGQVDQLVEIIQYKDLKIDALKLRCCHVYDNIQRLTNAKVFEQGHAMVYGLDRAMQDVRFFQEHVRSFEDELTKAMHQKFRHKIQDNQQVISRKDKQLHDLHQHIQYTIEDLMLKEQKSKTEKIHAMRVRQSNLDDFIADQQTRKQAEQSNSDSIIQSSNMKQLPPIKASTMLGRPNQSQLHEFSLSSDLHSATEKSKQRKKEEDDDLIMSADKASEVIIRLQDKMLRQRTFWDMRFHTLKKSLEDQIHFLEDKLSSNQDLWENLANEQNRQKILQSSLATTQKSAMENQKLIDGMKEQLQRTHKEKQVLENIDKTKTSKLQELEYKMKGLDLSKNLNVEKLIDLIIKQDKELKELKKSEQYWKQRVQTIEGDTNTKINILKRQIELEHESKGQAIKRNEELQKRVQIYQMDSSKTQGERLAEIWKTKFDEMFKVSQKLANENQKLQEQLSNQMMRKTTQVFSGQKSSSTIPMKMVRGVARATGGFNQKQSIQGGAAGTLLENSSQSQTDVTSATGIWSRDEQQPATFEQGNLFMKSSGLLQRDMFPRIDGDLGPDVRLGKFSVLNVGADKGFGIQFDPAEPNIDMRADTITNKSFNESMQGASMKNLSSRNLQQQSQRQLESSSLGVVTVNENKRKTVVDEDAFNGSSQGLYGAKKLFNKADQTFGERMASTALGQGFKSVQRGTSQANLNYFNKDLQKIDSNDKLVIPALNYGSNIKKGQNKLQTQMNFASGGNTLTGYRSGSTLKSGISQPSLGQGENAYQIQAQAQAISRAKFKATNSKQKSRGTVSVDKATPFKTEGEKHHQFGAMRYKAADMPTGFESIILKKKL